MNDTERQGLWERLRAAGLVEGAMPAAEDPSSPWYVRVMLGAAGWIGALFLLGFIGLAFHGILDSEAAMLAAGALCCIGAYGLFQIAEDNDFATQFGLALSFAGQGLAIFALFGLFRFETSATYFLIFGLEAALALFWPSFIHRMLTSWAAVFALSLALSRSGLPGITPGLAAAGFAGIWLSEPRWGRREDIWRPIGYGLALYLVQAHAVSLLGGQSFLWRSLARAEAHGLIQYAVWAGRALVILVFMGSVVRLLGRSGIAPAERTGAAILATAALTMVLAWFAPGAGTALLIVVLGFAGANRPLMGLGLAALGLFLSGYYYQMQATLLVKSLVLAVSGGLLLGGRWVWRIWFPLTLGKEHPHA
jgi:hypothetical protein